MSDSFCGSGSCGVEDCGQRLFRRNGAAFLILENTFSK